LVTIDNAYLWTDGRYFLQAETQLSEDWVWCFPVFLHFLHFHGIFIDINEDGTTQCAKFEHFPRQGVQWEDDRGGRSPLFIFISKRI